MYVVVIIYSIFSPYFSAASYSGNISDDKFVKNFNADLTNPNIDYAYEDPLKVEHVYDEIKQKEGYNNPGKYFSVRFFITYLHI